MAMILPILMVNRPGPAEAVWFISSHHSRGVTEALPAVVCLSLCRLEVDDEFEQTVIVEPVKRH